ncbi:hypothetical protein MHUMG1_02298 [Metarhizium humberi]|uniref:Uncharacterized protein n=1 Tax=Metarhizium humberi TaxID=2596975 RepID=A0A9P8MFU4_9HYPO|nr:hypothetical protein MHUMG1_02298 [Metarhizium humberi]
MRIITPDKRPRHRLRRLILPHRGAPVPYVPQPSGVGAKVDAAVTNVRYPDVAVDVKVKVAGGAGAPVAGEDPRRRAREVGPREALEGKGIPLRPGLVAEELDRLRGRRGGGRGRA